MSTAKKPTPSAPTPRAPDVARMNAALRASGIDYQVEGEKVDMRAYAKAISKRFPKIVAKLAK
jgi:hypothetical protein